MRRIQYTPYLILTVCLFSLMSLSTERGDFLRGAVVKVVSPFWSALNSSKLWVATHMRVGATPPLASEQIEVENRMLRDQIEKIAEWLLFEERIEEQWERLKTLKERKEGELFWKEFFQRRSEHLAELIDLQMQALPARVIFRDAAGWSSSLWVNVGEKDNEALGKTIVAKNSPVVLGAALVGVVEQVERSRCRIRLITDAGLVPSVRAVRGGEQNRALLEHLDAVVKTLETRSDLFSEEAMQGLLNLKNRCVQQGGEQFLAKGEVYGSNSQALRSHSQVLKGVGFNYDFDDAEGAARDLRMGGILKEGDLLVTSGFDGVFPPGLHVAVVSKIEQLREGAVSYELEARAVAPNLHDLNQVLILPPLNRPLAEF